MTSTQITGCRACGSIALEEVLSLGKQALTGVFPRSISENLPLAELSLMWCRDCSLVQLGHDFDPATMYGDNYGYRSGLNPRMVSHLERKAQWLMEEFPPGEGEVVLDIGSNDGTLLNSYCAIGLERVGFDPVASKYREFYEPGVVVVEDFFDSNTFFQLSSKKPKIVTSIAMFYDLEKPQEFVRQIAEVLDPQGVWHFEQSYLPAMLRNNSYDTICHEHCAYYSLEVVQNILGANGLRIVDVQINSVNGGSFAVTAAHETSSHEANSEAISRLLGQEKTLGLDTVGPYLDFAERVRQHRDQLISLISSLRTDGKTVAAYGASTKGNVLLQYCGFGQEDIMCVAEVNAEKFGKFTPGSLIPILAEEEVRALRPDYMLVLPWHFRDYIVEKEAHYLKSGGKLIFPLAQMEIVS